MIKKYVVVIAFFLGIIIGMSSQELILPTMTGPDHVYYHGRRGHDQVAMTFNVDWGEEYIPAMLDLFDKKDVKVTFFVTGKWAKKNPDLLKEMGARGHEIGNHGYYHAHPRRLTKDGLIDLIKKNEELIFRLTDQQNKIFSPPFGEVDQRVANIAHSIGYKTIMWSADTIDWQRPAPEIIVQRAVNKVDDGGIILMHPTKPTLVALEEIIDTIRGRGFEFVPVSRLLK